LKEATLPSIGRCLKLRLPYFRRGIFPPPRRLLVWHVKPAQRGPFHLSFSPEVRCIASKPVRGSFNIFDSGSCSGASARGSFCVDSGKRRARFVAQLREPCSSTKPSLGSSRSLDSMILLLSSRQRQSILYPVRGSFILRERGWLVSAPTQGNVAIARHRIARHYEALVRVPTGCAEEGQQCRGYHRAPFGSNACSRSPELAVEAAPHAQRRLGRSKIAAAALANNRPQIAAYIGTIDWAARLKAQINKQNGRYEAAHLRRGGILMPVR
jgi:hypothetical protein